MIAEPVAAERHVCLLLPDNEVALIPEDADELPTLAEFSS